MEGAGEGWLEEAGKRMDGGVRRMIDGGRRRRMDEWRREEENERGEGRSMDGKEEGEGWGGKEGEE